MTLTSAQRSAIENGEPVRITIDGIDCIVLGADAYDTLGAAESLTHEELRGMLARSAEGSDWLDPAMDIYDDYDAHR
ncbi:MAG: hypothetical protein KY475_01810 [Planctomycetes bacterium]|nr:hypothetical protein [Planctomycetota bacterium]